MSGLPVRRFRSRVLGHRELAPQAFELTLERHDLEFRAGQLVMIHGRSVFEDRSYSVASGEADPHLVLLYRLIPHGLLTPQLARLAPGDTVDLSGPYGTFTLREPSRPALFVATGTGIAPGRSFRRTYPDLDLRVVHGCRTRADLFYRDEWPPESLTACLSRDPDAPGAFAGRVTDWFAARPADPALPVYLCGANAMILDVRALLTRAGTDASCIFTEPYYYRA